MSLSLLVTLAHSRRTATDAGERRGGGGPGTERPSSPLATAACCVSSAAGFAQNAIQLVVSITKTPRGMACRKKPPKMVMTT